LALVLAAALAVPVAATGEAATYSTDGYHDAPALEATLPGPSLDGAASTASLADEAAATEWDEDFALHYILASTCRELGHFQLAVQHGGRPVRALRFAGADQDRLREGYLQARRFVGPASGGTAAPFGWFTASAGWRPATIVLDGRTVIDYAADTGGFFAYMAGDTVYEIEADVEELSAIVSLLPEPGGDPSLPMPVEPAPVACRQADKELLALLPETLGDHELEPYPLPPGFARRFLRDAEMTGDVEAASGYLLFVTVGSFGAAFRVPGAERSELKDACRTLLDLRKGRSRVVDWGGRRVLTDKARDDACYIRGEMLFAFSAPGLTKRIIRSIPLPDARGSGPSASSGP
ncbi:MAG: hypothetical protein PVG27_11245, partial [Chloroflexota bacterium]